MSQNPMVIVEVNAVPNENEIELNSTLDILLLPY